MVLHQTNADVESNAADEPVGVATRGLPRAQDAHIVRKHTSLQVNANDLGRTVIIHPGSHARTSTSIMTGSVPTGADHNSILARNEAYRDHCGHGAGAQLCADGRLGAGRTFIADSFLGATSTVQGSLRSSATWTLDVRDPLRCGFVVH